MGDCVEWVGGHSVSVGGRTVGGGDGGRVGLTKKNTSFLRFSSYMYNI